MLAGVLGLAGWGIWRAGYRLAGVLGLDAVWVPSGVLSRDPRGDTIRAERPNFFARRIDVPSVGKIFRAV